MMKDRNWIIYLSAALTFKEKDMLVLARKAKQVIQIADGLIEVHVISVKGSQVRIGIQAPDDIKIVRKELKEKD